jgi:hypothetical protein
MVIESSRNANYATVGAGFLVLLLNIQPINLLQSCAGTWWLDEPLELLLRPLQIVRDSDNA